MPYFHMTIKLLESNRYGTLLDSLKLQSLPPLVLLPESGRRVSRNGYSQKQYTSKSKFVLSQKNDFFLETINTYRIITKVDTILFCYYGLTVLLASTHVIRRQRLQHHTFPLLAISNGYFPGEMDLPFP